MTLMRCSYCLLVNVHKPSVHSGAQAWRRWRDADNMLSVHRSVQCIACCRVVPLLHTTRPWNALHLSHRALAQSNANVSGPPCSAAPSAGVLPQLDHYHALQALVAVQHGRADTTWKSEAHKQHMQQEIAAQGTTALACLLQHRHSARQEGRLAPEGKAHQAWRKVPCKAILQASAPCHDIQFSAVARRMWQCSEMQDAC